MSYYLDILSIERKIFSDVVKKIKLIGILGGLEIYPGHVPLLTNIKPGTIYIVNQYGLGKSIYLSGGVLVVQPKIVTILADIAANG